MIFANVRNNEIIDFNSFYIDKDIERVETTQEMQNAYEEDKNKIVYQDGKIVLNSDWETIEKQKHIQEKRNSIILQLEELDKKRIRAICEGGQNPETGETWLEYYNKQVQNIRKELKELSI